MRRKNAVNSEKVIKKALARVTARDVVKPPRKTARIPLRLTQEDKDGIERIASKLGLSVADYLVALHRHAHPRLR